jgi:hypothetical protein
MDSVPLGFKIVGPERGSNFYCATCDAPAERGLAQAGSPPRRGLKQNLMGSADCEPTLTLVPGRSGTSTSKARPQFTHRAGAVSLKGGLTHYPNVETEFSGIGGLRTYVSFTHSAF